MLYSLPVYEVYNIQVFAFKNVQHNVCHPIEVNSKMITEFLCLDTQSWPMINLFTKFHNNLPLTFSVILLTKKTKKRDQKAVSKVISNENKLFASLQV